MPIIATVAACSGTLAALIPLFQARRIVQLRSSRDVSLITLTVFCIHFSVWFAYGLFLSNVAMILTYSVALLVMVATLALALRYRTGTTATAMTATEISQSDAA